MKKKGLSFTLASLVVALIMVFNILLINKQQVDYVTALPTRTVELKVEQVDYESILNSFDDAVLTQEGSTTYFEGYKSISLSDLEAIDNLSQEDVDNATQTVVKYNYSYDNETNIVTLSATLQDEDGTVIIDTIEGTAFINEQGDIDALLEVDGEYVLLSELQDAGMIQNCGWFSKIIKAVVAVVVVAAVAAVVVATAGAGMGAVIAAGAIAGGITGGIAGGVISYQETGSVQIWAVAGGIIGGAVLGGLTGWAVGTVMGVGTKATVGFSKGSFNTAKECLEYHFQKHGAEVGAKSVAEYSKMAANVAQQVVKEGIPAVRAVSGATANVFRYEVGKFYIHMAMSAKEIIIVSFGLL